MSTPPLLAAALKHKGQAGPVNTCMSNGVERWAREAGIPPIDGNGSCSQGSRQAHAGHNGWRVIPVSQARPGDVLYWRIAHVTVVVDVDHAGNIESIGSGTPSSRVALQPAGGGHNAPSNFREAWRPPAPKKAAAPKPPAKPAAKPAPKPAAKPKPKPVPTSQQEHTTARAGEGGIKIAARTKVPLAALKRLNPNVKDWGELRLGQTIRTK